LHQLSTLTNHHQQHQQISRQHARRSLLLQVRKHDRHQQLVPVLRPPRVPNLPLNDQHSRCSINVERMNRKVFQHDGAYILPRETPRPKAKRGKLTPRAPTSTRLANGPHHYHPSR
ncbi:hypothetical protein CSPX01_15517, partial [Colletotrichum filicis]